MSIKNRTEWKSNFENLIRNVYTSLALWTPWENGKSTQLKRWEPNARIAEIQGKCQEMY